jgi:hypothetical protein
MRRASLHRRERIVSTHPRFAGDATKTQEQDGMRMSSAGHAQSMQKLDACASSVM